MIRRWPGISAADKLAWDYLWELSREGLEQVVVTGAMVAADQNTSGDAGLKRIKNLRSHGIVELVDHNRTTGQYWLVVRDPVEVAKAKRIEWDGQLGLPFADEEVSGNGHSEDAGSEATTCAAATADCTPVLLPRVVTAAAEEPPEEPPEEPRRPTFTSVREISLTSTSDRSPRTNRSEAPESYRRRGTSGGTAAGRERRGDAGGERSIGDLAGSLMRRMPSPAEQATAVQEWVDLIFARVDCPRLKAAPVVVAARAIVDGELPAARLESLLANLDRERQAGRLRSTPSAYFNGGLNQLKAQYGLQSTGGKPR